MYSLKYSRISHSGKKISYIKNSISKFINTFKDNLIVFEHLYKYFHLSKINIDKINNDIKIIESKNSTFVII